jgi:acetoin utilization protein AcuB
MMPTIDMFMTRAPYCVTSIDTLERARELMDRHMVRHLPVVAGTEVVGVLLDRELVVIEAMPGIDTRMISAARAMRPALSVSENLEIDEAIDLMIEHDLDCLVVRDEHGLVDGIFTAIDALHAIATLARATGPATRPFVAVS